MHINKGHLTSPTNVILYWDLGGHDKTNPIYYTADTFGTALLADGWTRSQQSAELSGLVVRVERAPRGLLALLEAAEAGRVGGGADKLPEQALAGHVALQVLAEG